MDQHQRRPTPILLHSAVDISVQAHHKEKKGVNFYDCEIKGHLPRKHRLTFKMRNVELKFDVWGGGDFLAHHR